MTVDHYFGLYHETFHFREDGETFFSHRGVQRPLDRLTRFSAVGENAAHGECHSINTEPDSALSRPPRSPLHLVPGADEKASRRWQAVRPLHLPKVRLPAHNQARPKTTQPHALASIILHKRCCDKPSTGRLAACFLDILFGGWLPSPWGLSPQAGDEICGIIEGRGVPADQHDLSVV